MALKAWGKPTLHIDPSASWYGGEAEESPEDPSQQIRRGRGTVHARQADKQRANHQADRLETQSQKIESPSAQNP